MLLIGVFTAVARLAFDSVGIGGCDGSESIEGTTASVSSTGAEIEGTILGEGDGTGVDVAVVAVAVEASDD